MNCVQIVRLAVIEPVALFGAETGDIITIRPEEAPAVVLGRALPSDWQTLGEALELGILNPIDAAHCCARDAIRRLVPPGGRPALLRIPETPRLRR